MSSRPTVHNRATGTSPPLAPTKVSPQLTPAPRSSGNSPAVAPAAPPNTGTFRPPAPFSLGESATAAGGVTSSEKALSRRTDPGKFKTDLCRNYEQTGSCNFKGCTFAHGPEDLRSTGSSKSQSSGGQQTSPTTSPHAYVNHLAELLVMEVNKEVYNQLEHQEANRALEYQLRDEQIARQTLLKDLSAATKKKEELQAEVSEKDKLLAALKRQLKGMNVALPPARPPPADVSSPTEPLVQALAVLKSPNKAGGK